MFVFQLPQKSFSWGEISSPAQQHDVIFFLFFPRVCTNVYFHACWSCRLQQVTEGWEQKQAQAAAHDERHPVAKTQEEGKVAGCESMQEIAATIAPSCTVNLSNIKAAKWKSCSLLCMMWHCNASVNRFKCKQKRSSQLDGVDLYMGASYTVISYNEGSKVNSWSGHFMWSFYSCSPCACVMSPSHMHIRLITRLHVWVY